MYNHGFCVRLKPSDASVYNETTLKAYPYNDKDTYSQDSTQP